MLPLNEESKNEKRRHALVMLAIAGALLIGALIWSVLLNKNGFTARVSRELKAYGADVDARDLVQHSFKRNTSIQEMLGGEDVSEAVSVSMLAGLPSDIGRTGDVTCLIANTSAGVLTVYVVDDTVELAFIQTEHGELLPIGGGRE